jgi:Flp pilus assembly protein TadB
MVLTVALSMLNFLSKRTMKGEKATAKTSLFAGASVGGACRITLRLFQFVMGLVVIGLYAQDLHKARKAGVYQDSKWIYATFCGSASCFFAIVLALPLVKSWALFAIDILIWFFWLVCFGIFGKMYLKMDNKGDKGIIRMQRAAWIDMVNMLLWFSSAVYGAFIFWKWRKGRTDFTGRAASVV